MYRLLYISRSRLPAAEADEVVQGIVDVSRRRNTREGITGALMFTGNSFAQILEGAEEPVQRLMADIRRDRAHDGIEIVREGPADTRQFAGWSMAYWGRSAYVANLVEAVRAGGSPLHRRASLNALALFMRESARAEGPARR